MGKREGSDLGLYRTERWRKLSKELRGRHRACQVCGAQGHLIVDHLRELKDGGAPFDLANLIVVCAKCHGTKTYRARIRREPIAMAVGLDGLPDDWR